ncbi:uncharacterized protein LOC128963510 [Oppia nitens]|uniref:uncharacterized protein LOC128963510 n=1 Tax=Oppia nitens TaxID=1686743 RepID=UPI0023D9DADF|nr:uncharacterized protein LOC128963510 [Oppia nitens]
MAVTLSTTKKPSKTKKPPKSPSIKPVKLPADRPQNTGKPAKGTPKPKPGKNQQKPTKQSNKPVKASTNNPGKASSTKKSKVPPNKWGQPNQNNLNNKSTKKPFVLDLTENFIP